MASPLQTEIIRCDWCGTDPLYRQYHDTEWGRPCREDKKLFEFLLLESAQAGLAWITVLRKREGYRKAFAGFEVDKVARFNQRSVERLMKDASIVRNRQKITSAINNAKQFMAVQDQYGSFADYLWGFVDGTPILNHWDTLAEIPASTTLSDTISKDMKQRGFRFFGTTICYAYLQAMGVVNDHLVSCSFRHGS